MDDVPVQMPLFKLDPPSPEEALPTVRDYIFPSDDDPVIWACECFTCERSFELLIPPQRDGR